MSSHELKASPAREGWFLKKDLEPIEIPDQAGYVKKLACKECLDQIGVENKKA